jgi:hypothetical protein
LVKPTLETRFHIDYAWWERQGRELRVYLQSHLCPEHREIFEGQDLTEEIDWIDPKTAEVTRVDGLQHTLRIHCSREADYITDRTALVDGVFRVFLANGNHPLTPNELASRIGRSAETILRTLSGPTVYKGIRPYLGAE